MISQANLFAPRKPCEAKSFSGQAKSFSADTKFCAARGEILFARSSHTDPATPDPATTDRARGRAAAEKNGEQKRPHPLSFAPQEDCGGDVVSALRTSHRRGEVLFASEGPGR